MSYRDIVRDRNFLLYACGQATSQFGSAMMKAGLALFVLHASGSASLFSSILALGFLPMLVLYPFSGLLVDRVDRRKLLVTLDLTRAASLCALIALQAVLPLGLWAAAAYVAFSASCEAFANPAGNTIVPHLFEKERYDLANAANAWALNAAAIAAPAAGVWIFSRTGLTGLLVVDACTFVVGASCSALLRLRPLDKPVRTRMRLSDVTEGFALLTRRELALPTLAVAVSRAFIDPVSSLVIPFLLVTVLRASDYGVGLAQAASVAGVLAAPLIVARLRSRHGTLDALQRSRSGKIIVYIAFALGGAFVVRAGPAPAGVVPVVFLAAVCFGGAIFNAAGFAFLNSHFQKSVPPGLMGRFAASRFMTYTIAQPIGLMLYGFVLDTRLVGLALALAAAAACAETLLLRSLKAVVAP